MKERVTAREAIGVPRKKLKGLGELPRATARRKRYDRTREEKRHGETTRGLGDSRDERARRSRGKERESRARGSAATTKSSTISGTVAQTEKRKSTRTHKVAKNPE